ncbi:MAG: hypothetical protein ACO1N6_11980 [Microcella sp.]
MISLGRRAVAAAASVLLVAGLAACAPAEPEAQPQPTVTPSATPTPVGPTPPGSRVPVPCDEILQSTEAFAATSVNAEPFPDLPLIAVLAQSGFDLCTAEGALGGTAVSVTFVAAVDVTDEWTVSTAERLAENGYPSGFGGDASWSTCRASDAPSYCESEVLAGRYLAYYSVAPAGEVAADFDESVVAFGADLADRMTQWPAPAAPWTRQDGALAWASDCEGEVAQTDAPVRAALGFESYGAKYSGGGDGAAILFLADTLQDRTLCEWSSQTGAGRASVDLVPGAAWLLDDGAVLPGTPITYPGAVAATSFRYPGSSSIDVHLIIDGSYLVVQYQNDGLGVDDQADLEGALRVADAIAATFGAP